MAFKRPSVKKTVTTLNSLRIYLRSVKKFGKTTVFRDIVMEEYGDAEKGLLVGCGKEMGYTLLDNLNTSHIESWKDALDLKKWLIEEKGKEHDIELIAFDVVDEIVPLVEQYVCKLSTQKDGKICDSINKAFGGYGKGQEKVKEVLKDYFFELYKAGFGLFAIAHTKTKNIIEKGMEDSEGYQQLTSNLSNSYEGVFGDIFDIVLTGMIDREVIDGKTVSAIRKLYFRGNHYVDAGCRFSQNSVPEYMVFENENNAPEFLQILKDGMKGSISKPISDKEFENMVKEEKEESKKKAEEVAQEIKQKELEENAPTKEELIEQLKSKMNDSNKKTVITLVKGFGCKNVTELNEEQIQSIITEISK